MAIGGGRQAVAVITVAASGTPAFELGVIERAGDDGPAGQGIALHPGEVIRAGELVGEIAVVRDQGEAAVDDMQVTVEELEVL